MKIIQYEVEHEAMADPRYRDNFIALQSEQLIKIAKDNFEARNDLKLVIRLESRLQR